MADIQVSPVADDTQSTPTSGARLDVWTTHLIGYSFYARSNVGINGSIYYVKTTDGGQTWGASTKVNSTTEEAGATQRFSVYYDQWTPGISTTKIHIAWLERIGVGVTYEAPIKYRALDTSNDSLGTEVQVTLLACGSGLCGNAARVSIVRSRGADLYIHNTATTVIRSTDDGATWPTATSVFAQGRLLPGGEIDPSDILLIETDAADLTYRIFDASAQTWSSSGVIDTSVNATAIQAEGATRKSDNHKFVAYQLNKTGSTKDLRVIEITIGTTWTQLTNVFTNEADHSHTISANQVALAVDQFNTDHIYVGYGGIVGDATQQGFKKSVDGGVTWGAQQVFGEDTVTGREGIFLAMNTSLVGGRIYGTWQVVANRDIFGNFANSIALQSINSRRRVGFGGYHAVRM